MYFVVIKQKNILGACIAIDRSAIMPQWEIPFPQYIIERLLCYLYLLHHEMTVDKHVPITMFKRITHVKLDYCSSSKNSVPLII